MNKLRSKKYIYWQIPSPTFTPVERNRIIKILFNLDSEGPLNSEGGFWKLIREGVHFVSLPCYKKRPNGKYFKRVVNNFTREDKHKTLFKYVYTRHQCWRMDKEQERIEQKIKEINSRIALRD